MTEPNLLVVDASSSLCSAALLTQGNIYSMVEEQPRRQAQRLLPLVSEVLAQAGCEKRALQGIAYGRGPGSFTGIRIAASVMQGIALALELPVFGVSSLQAVAAELFKQEAQVKAVLVVMNAHMGEVFWGRFERDGVLCRGLGIERVGSPEECLTEIARFSGALAGNGLQLAEFSHLDQQYATLGPKAEAMLPLVLDAWKQQHFGKVADHLPVYLRDSVAWKKLDEQPSLLRR